MREADINQATTSCIRAWHLLRLAHDRVSGRLGAELARECGLTIHEFDVLFYLRVHSNEDVRMSALLDAVPLSQPALSRLVARLTERGLVGRCGIETDGRAVIVSLTDAGAALIDRASVLHARIVHDALTSKFTESEQTALLATLDQIGR
ncbi:MAG TPA: MarR family transcriptional regulator [Thermomicrobiales bacterium]|nr:MarR family transcriptional regulator [Thermomicrobiales bacterium]